MVNQEMLDYIRQEEERGVTREAIREALVLGGWLDSDIEGGFQAVDSATDISETEQSEVQQTQVKRSPGKKMFIALGVVIVLALVASILFVIFNNVWMPNQEDSGALIIDEDEAELVEDIEMDELGESEADWGLTEEQIRELEEMLATIERDQLEFITHLEDCSPFEGLHTNALTRERTLKRQIHGVVAGSCLHTEDLPSEGVLECSYPDGSWITLAAYYKAIINAEGVSTDTRVSPDGTEISVTFVDGVEIENALQEAYNNGHCVESY